MGASSALRSTDSGTLFGEHVRAQIPTAGALQQGVRENSGGESLTAEARQIRHALEATRWNVRRAAEMLGYGRTKMYQRMRVCGILRKAAGC